MVFSAVVVTEATLKAELVVNKGCFPLSALAMSPTPVRVMLLDALSVDAATDDTFTALVVVSVACFAERAVAMLPTPVIVNAPPTFTIELSTAAPSQCSSRVATTSRP